MQFSPAALLPLITQLGSYLKAGVDHYATLRAAGSEADVEVVAAFLTIKMSDWDPKVGGVSLLDDGTRAAAARFLSGVAVNIARA